MDEYKDRKILVCSKIEDRNSIVEEALIKILQTPNLKKFNEYSSKHLKNNNYLKNFEIFNGYTKSDDNEDEWEDKTHEIFLSTVTHIRLFHACRPLSLESYLNKGIVKANQDDLENLAREIWITDNSSNQHKANVETAIQASAVFFTPYEKRVFLIVDDRVLLKTASHYLIRGSEYLQAISAKIEGNFVGEYKDPLRTRGIPTIIECDIPVVNLKDKLKDLWNVLISLYLSSQFYSDDIDEGIDYTITMDHVLPELITGHSHPVSLRDPHNGMKLVEFNDLNCSHCLTAKR